MSRELTPWREQSRRRDTRDKGAEIERHMETKEQREGRRKKETRGIDKGRLRGRETGE
jgi:hypothetical protein